MKVVNVMVVRDSFYIHLEHGQRSWKLSGQDTWN